MNASGKEKKWEQNNLPRKNDKGQNARIFGPSVFLHLQMAQIAFIRTDP
jgi:hypothetical protein